MKKSTILAALLVPSFCLAQTKEEKKHQITTDMIALILKMIAADHLITMNLWSEYLSVDKEVAEKARQDGLKTYEEAEELFNQLEELNKKETP